MGVPIVAFDLSETRHSAQDAALYATPNRVEELADLIEVLLGDPALRARMAAIGRRRIQEELSQEHSSMQLIEAYEASFGPPVDQLPIRVHALAQHGRERYNGTSG
jgi:glycosyltransferase involved in cell wall biosynthesis